MSLLNVKVGPQTVQVSSKFLITMNNHIVPPTVCTNCSAKLFIPYPPLPYILTPLPPSHLHTHSPSQSCALHVRPQLDLRPAGKIIIQVKLYGQLTGMKPSCSLLLPPPSPHSPSLSPYPPPTSSLIPFSYLLLPVLVILLIVVQNNVKCVSRGTSGHVVYPMGGTWHSLCTETLLLQKWQVQGVVSSHLSSHNESTSGLI